jgi:hypothetical protein
MALKDSSLTAAPSGCPAKNGQNEMAVKSGFVRAESGDKK